MTIPPPTSAVGQTPPSWSDTTRSIDERVDLVLAEMTLEEKVAQLGSRWVGNDMPESGGAMSSPKRSQSDREEALNVAPMQDVFAAAGSPLLEDAGTALANRAVRNAVATSLGAARHVPARS